jgi:hypothetical protein
MDCRRYRIIWGRGTDATNADSTSRDPKSTAAETEQILIYDVTCCRIFLPILTPRKCRPTILPLDQNDRSATLLSAKISLMSNNQINGEIDLNDWYRYASGINSDEWSLISSLGYSFGR